MSKLRASIIAQHKIDEIKAIQKQILTESIAGPITELDLEEENIINIHKENTQEEISIDIQEEENIQEDLDNDEINDETQISNWNKLIENWEHLLLQEEEAEQQAEIDLDFDIEINDILIDQTHPALDQEAKWNIEQIFIDDLEIPFFIDK